ncbi:sugar-phosphatase [Pasteurella langaaensis DSM 22999]|uniref:Sugar-phosphatase n=1 Tax=Alitibacter langaaensis DSM 22999 TaxID=1122935 RepID=A0A2U0SQ11_9PAST|nr:hexitol phosphatase HxpB [Pasteurella langaaensis]PVX33422.1 sugar-phosphatase [Pasteurella langaaensis DSM 22999]
MQIQAVIFDMDGTLINSEPIWNEAEVQYFNQQGYPVTRADIANLRGLHIGGVTDYVLHHYADYHSGKSPEELSQELLDYAIAIILKKKPLIDGVRETLSYLHEKKIKLAVASASPLYMLEEIVKSCGIAQYFDYLSSAEELEYNKPHPMVYLHAAQKLGVPAKHCLAVEDSVTGMISAKSANMKCAVVPESEHWHDARWAISDFKFTQISEIKKLFD